MSARALVAVGAVAAVTVVLYLASPSTRAPSRPPEAMSGPVPPGIDPRFWASSTAKRNGWDNTPPASVWAQLARTQAGVGAIEAQIGRVIVTSGYRNLQVNAAVGGVSNSAHMHGRAVDLKPRAGQTLEQIRDVAAMVFDLVIIEEDATDAWVHAENYR